MWVCVWSNTTFILRRDIERMHTLPDSQIPNMLARVGIGKLEKVGWSTWSKYCAQS